MTVMPGVARQFGELIRRKLNRSRDDDLALAVIPSSS